jgi:nucleoside-diphosphate kinase
VVSMVLQGDDAVQQVRSMVGGTDPKKASPGTIRGDFGIEMSRNIIHASDSLTSSEREISLFYDQSELMTYSKINEIWLYT